MAPSCTWGGLDWTQEKFPHRKGGQAQEQAAQGSGGMTLPGVFTKCVDVVLRGMVLGLMVGLSELGGLFQIKQFCDSVNYQIIF